MALKQPPSVTAKHREAIRTSDLVRRLQAFVLGEIDRETGKPVLLSRDQVSAITCLLRKVIPDMAAITISGDADNPVQSSLTVVFKQPPVEHGQTTITVQNNALAAPVVSDREAGAVGDDSDL